MNFRPELAEKVMAGEKTVTRRATSGNPYSPWFEKQCSLKVGRSYAVCPGRGKNAIGRVVVTDVEKARLGYLTEDEARAEGFESAEEFEAVWTEINGTYWRSQFVWRVEFRVDPDSLVIPSVTLQPESLEDPDGEEL